MVKQEHIPGKGKILQQLGHRIRSAKSMIALTDQVVASATNFLTGIIIARSCSQGDFGLYMLCFSLIVFALDLQTSLLSSPYMVYSQRLKGKQLAVYLGNSLIQQFLLVLAILSILIAAIMVTKYNLGPEGRGIYAVLPALTLVIWPIMLREFIRRVCFAGLEMSTALVIDCGIFLIQVGGLLLLSFFDLLSVATGFYCIGLACASGCLGWLWVHRKMFVLGTKKFQGDFKKNLTFGKWIFASSLLWALSMTLYPWLLAFFHGTAATGIWGACYGVVAIANPLLLGIQNYLWPKIIQAYTRNGRQGLSRFVMRSSLFCGLLLLPLAIFFVIFGGWLVSLLYGARYSGTGPVVSILAVNLILAAITFPPSRGILALERARSYFMANIVPFMVMMTCGILLVRQFAVTGVALALLAGAVSTAVIMFFVFGQTRSMR